MNEKIKINIEIQIIKRRYYKGTCLKIWKKLFNPWRLSVFLGLFCGGGAPKIKTLL